LFIGLMVYWAVFEQYSAARPTQLIHFFIPALKPVNLFQGMGHQFNCLFVNCLLERIGCIREARREIARPTQLLHFLEITLKSVNLFQDGTPQ